MCGGWGEPHSPLAFRLMTTLYSCVWFMEKRLRRKGAQAMAILRGGQNSLFHLGMQ
jgi:hypothetical protein